MSEQLSELPLRYAERILVSCFNHLQLSERDKIPAFETMPELLNWIHSWLQNQYLNNSSKTDDISLCIRAVQYIQEHVTERCTGGSCGRCSRNEPRIFQHQIPGSDGRNVS